MVAAAARPLAVVQARSLASPLRAVVGARTVLLITEAVTAEQAEAVLAAVQVTTGRALASFTAQAEAVGVMQQEEQALVVALAATVEADQALRYEQAALSTMAAAVAVARLKTPVVLVVMAAWAAAAPLKFLAQIIPAYRIPAAVVLALPTIAGLPAQVALALS